MSETEEKIHVIPLSGHWEVENQSGIPLACEDSQEDAIRDARAIAQHQHIDKIILHDGDGVTEDISLAAPEEDHPAVIPPAQEA